ncbi:MAG: hypothetical protein BWK80_16060 [Desulfobacteraceae bacterium IS3]|nr:MAG: hypothetical protein BWK80_16060 [Desulfobacteraceae bacterium IS3]
MGLTEIFFKIIEDNNCPLYDLGDEFSLSDTALFLPQNKAVCLKLTQDISQMSRLEISPDTAAGPDSKDNFYCGGCTGLIRLSYKHKASQAETGVKDSDDIDTIASLLSNFSFFQTLSENEIRELVSCLNLRKFEKDEFILRKGELGTNLFILIFGRVEVVGDDNISIAFLGKGEVFGEMSLLSGDPVGASIKVVDPATLLFINGKDFRSVLKKFPSLQMYFARLLARRLARTNVVRSEEFGSAMVGKLSDMPPSELFQTLNTNQKSGVLTLQLSKGSADLVFRDGRLISAKYNNEESEEAFYEILKEKEGRFRFTPGLSEEDMEADEIGDFMWLLMEGVRRLDEEEAGN